MAARMAHVSGRAGALLVILVATVTTSCGDYGGDDGEPSPLPSGSLGPVTPNAADEAVLGLCEIVHATDRDSAAAAFADRSHQTLHVIAAATEEDDRAAAAGLLIAKQLVEADLSEPTLPEGFAGDVEALLVATRGALEAIGLAAPPCPA